MEVPLRRKGDMEGEMSLSLNRDMSDMMADDDGGEAASQPSIQARPVMTRDERPIE